MDDAAAWPTGRLLSAAARRVEREWDAHLAAWNLTHASFPVLFLLLGGGRSQRELAATMAVTEQTMSRICARLEASGFVERRSDPGNRRRNVVALLPRGTAVLAAAADPRPIEEMATRGLTAGQVTALREALLAMLSSDVNLRAAAAAEPGHEAAVGTAGVEPNDETRPRQ